MCLQITWYLYAWYLYVDVVQMTMRLCSVLQQHRRRVSAVHLAGSYILTCMHRTVHCTGRRQHCSDVLMHALIAPAVLLLIGLIAGTNAGYMTGVVNVIRHLLAHSLKSSDHVIKDQVGYVT